MATQPKPIAPWGEYIPHVGRMSVEQFAQFPGEEGLRYELHEGRIIYMPGPGHMHARIQRNFFRTLDAYLAQHGLGGLNGTECYNLPLRNNQEELLCPDLSYVLPARETGIQMRGSYPVLAPDLVIEIASPGDTHPELATKATIYLQAGVRLIWVVWPKPQTIDIWLPSSQQKPNTTLKINDTLDGLHVVPGFQCSVREIFA
jgi:Uma2 family endonuclease